jgi:hypothetical protein
VVRRNQQQRRDERRDAAAAFDSVADQTRGSYRPPDRASCREKSWVQSIDDADTIRVHTSIWRRDGRIVDFALVVLVAGIDWSWTETARIDCCHGHVHQHHEDPAHRTSLKPLHVVDDVESGYEIASIRIVRYAITIRDRRTEHG